MESIEQTQKLAEKAEKLKLDKWKERFWKWSDIFRMLTGARYWEPVITIYQFAGEYRVALLTPRNEILLLTKKIGDAITIKEIVEKLQEKTSEIINNFLEDLSDFAEEIGDRLAKILANITEDNDP